MALQHRVLKLLDAAVTNTTGTAISIGRSRPPFTIYTTGGYSVVGINIQGAAEEAGTYSAIMGKVGGATTPAEVANLTGLVNISWAVIDYPVAWIRAVYPVGGTGTATVFLIYND